MRALVICLALSNVYGPRQRPHGVAGLITILASAMVTGLPFAVDRDHADAHDYVYVVDAFVRAGWAPIATLAEGIGHTVRWFCDTLESAPVAGDHLLATGA